MRSAAVGLGSSSFACGLPPPSWSWPPTGAARFVRLSAYRAALALARHLDESGELPASMIGRARAALGTMVALAGAFRAHPIAVGTSALRGWPRNPHSRTRPSGFHGALEEGAAAAGLETLTHELAPSPARLERLGACPERVPTLATGALVPASNRGARRLGSGSRAERAEGYVRA